MGGSDAGSFNGSMASSGSRAGRIVPGEDKDDDLPDGGIETGIFGTLYTVSKEKHPSLIFVCFRLLLDLVQMLLLVMNPVYGYTINPSNWAWQIFSFLQLNQFMMARGYTFFLACLYVMIAGLAFNLALCIWVSKSFANNSFGHVWPIVWLRFYSLIFYQVLDIASLTLFLMTLDCGYMSNGDMQFIHQEFAFYCFEFPHIIHIGVASVALVVFVVLATAFTTAEIDLNPASQNLLGMAHSKVDGVAFMIKVIMTSATVFLNEVRFLSIVLLITSAYMLWLYFYWEPHMYAHVNHVRVASYSMVFYAAITLVALAFPMSKVKEDPDLLQKHQNQVTIALWAGLAPVAGLGWLASWLRLRYFSLTVAQKFKDAPADMKSKYIHKFEDPREVEIASRVLRVWLDEDTLDPDAMALAERILKAGKTQLPNSPYMTILWSSFLIDVQESYISGYGQVQAAKKMSNLSVIERFAVFIREQEHAQKTTAASAGDSENVDLVSYVEFQRNYSVVLRLTKEAMLTRRGFWQALESHRMARFNKLAATVSRIDRSVRAAERMFRQVLNRHSNSVKILQLYVKFLQGVKNDPWTAAKWAAEAEKLQKAEEEANTKAVLGNQKPGADVDGDSNKGIIIIGANCLIRMANDAAVQAFGYEHKSALIGHNVNVIIPPPFNKNHNSYVRNYITTGQRKMLGLENTFVALHKDKYVLPIKVVVTHLSGIGEDSVFMGVIQMVPEAPNVASIWLLSTGKILSCNATFTDWFGFKQNDVGGKSLGDLVVEREEVERLINQVRSGATANTLENHKRGKVKKQVSRINGRPQSSNGDAASLRSTNTLTRPLLGPVAEGTEEEGTEPGAGSLHQGPQQSPRETISAGKSRPSSGLIPAVPAAGSDVVLGTDVDSTLALNSHLHSAFDVPHTHKRVSLELPTRPGKVSYNGLPAKALDGDDHHGPGHRPLQPVQSMSDASERTSNLSGRQSVAGAPKVLGQEWTLDDVRMKHNLSDETLLVNLSVQYGAIGDHIIYQVNMTRADDAGALMLVTDTKGRVRHVTQALATRLGTTVSRLHSSGVAHALDVLLPAPFVKLHHSQTWNLGSTQPLPWSCRSGLPMCVPAVTPKGLPETQIYMLSFEQRMSYPPGTVFLPGQNMARNAETQHVITFHPSSMEAAFDARRLHLVVSSAGKVVKVSPSPDALFGFDVQSLVGNTIAHVVDVLRPKAGDTAGSAGNEAHTSNVLKALADRNRTNPGLSWRVGVSGVVDPADIAALGIVGEDIVTQLTKPAVMTVKYLTAAPRMQGSKVIMPTEIQYEIDLWRADSMVGVVEVDMSGNIVSTGVPDQPFYEPHTLFGCPPGRMIGTPLSNWLPIRDNMKPSIALFTEGALSSTGAVAGTAKKGGGMKSRAVKSPVGPPHTPRIPHHADAADLDLRVTAVSKGAPGASNTYVILRFSATPAAGRPDFVSWLMQSEDLVPLPKPPAVERVIQPWRTRSSDMGQLPSAPTRFKTQDMEAQQLAEADTSNAGNKRSVQFPRNSSGASAAPEPDPSNPTYNELKGDSGLFGLVAPSQAGRRSSQLSQVEEWLEGPGSGLKVINGSLENVDYTNDPNSPWRMRTGTSELPDPNDNESVKDDDGENDTASVRQGQAPHDDDDVDDHAVVEDEHADAHNMTDYKRGKRYRKLSVILAGKEISGCINRLMWVVICMLVGLLVMECAAYWSFVTLVKSQDARVDFLYSNARVANEANRVLMHTQSLGILLSGQAVPGLRFLSNGTVNSSDMRRILTRMNTSINEVTRLHQGLYHGFDGEVQELPHDYGLRDFWEEPTINITVYEPDKLNPSFAPIGRPDTVSLWVLGNLFLMAARNVRDRGIELHQSGPTAYNNLSDVNFIKTNAIVTLNAAYRKASAGLLSLTLDRNREVITGQEIAFIIQVVLILIVAFVTIIFFAEALSLKRHRVYHVFTRVPVGVIHGLASAPLNIDDGQEIEDEDEEEEREARNKEQQEGNGGQGGGNEQDLEKAAVDGTARGVSRKDVTRQSNGGPEYGLSTAAGFKTGQQVQEAPVSRWRQLLCCCLPAPKVSPGTKFNIGPGADPTKSTFITTLFSTFSTGVENTTAKKGRGGIYGGDRGLVRSYVDTIWLIWPLLAWAAVVLAVNIISHENLIGLEGAISNLNVGGGVFQAIGRCNNWAIMMCAGYGNATLQAKIAKELGPSLDYLRNIYSDELYGQEGDPTDSTFDVTGPNPSAGVTFQGEGFYLLWNRTYLPNACLAYDTNECFNTTDLFYPFTSNGLDAMIQKYMTSVQDLLAYYEAGNATLSSSAFRFIWEVGTTNLLDGRRRMSLIYVAYVHTLYSNALNVHIVSFIFAFIIVPLVLLFILRPYIARVRAEPKRLAELLASLPPEIEVESMVRQAIMSKAEAEAADNKSAANMSMSMNNSTRGW